jgi:hypothetical protein
VSVALFVVLKRVTSAEICTIVTRVNLVSGWDKIKLVSAKRKNYYKIVFFSIREGEIYCVNTFLHYSPFLPQWSCSYTKARKGVPWLDPPHISVNTFHNYFQHIPCISLESFSHSLPISVGNENHAIILASDKSFHVVDIGQEG